MARIEKRKNKRGISYLATVRRKGFETVARTFDTKGEAIAWATGVEQDMKDQRYQNPRRAMNTSFGQALEKYINTISQKKAINTHMLEKSAARRLLEQIGAETPLGSITAATAAKYRDARLQEVSAYPVRHELALLSHLFTKAKKEWGIPVENPVADIERPAPPRGRTRFLTDEEAVKLLESSRKARNYRFYYYILTLLHTGMRSSEAAGLRWNQVNLKKRVIFLPDTKNKDTRWVPLTKELTEELSSLKKISKGKDENLV
ncbi:tyrosine-type recombinase/integrase, partial [Desulfomarina sp.]